MEPIAYLGETEIIVVGNREFASPSRWDRDPIGETELTRVCGSGYVKWTRWHRIELFGGAKFDFWFGTYVDTRKWLRAYLLAFWASKPLSHTSSPFNSIGFSYGRNMILDQ